MSALNRIGALRYKLNTPFSDDNLFSAIKLNDEKFIREHAELIKSLPVKDYDELKDLADFLGVDINDFYIYTVFPPYLVYYKDLIVIDIPTNDKEKLEKFDDMSLAHSSL